MPWHITPLENLPHILRDGLIPSIGPRSANLGEEIAAVHLFSRFDDLMSANWLESAFDGEETLALIYVAVPASKGAWTEIVTAVSPERIMLISRDLDEVADSPALRALDRVTYDKY